MAELETLGKVYPFSIPPFFALILRAFSVIEGIALTVDPDYSIVQVGNRADTTHWTSVCWLAFNVCLSAVLSIWLGRILLLLAVL
jgi:predicted unusual protein kinase regulating ubiquinone biosynthesis (AarF/ABC1/UbiB family)